MSPATGNNASASKTVNHLPIKNGKHAPKTFTGRFDRISEFFDELEGICNECDVTNPKEMCKGIVRYCNRKVVEVIQGLKAYHDKEYNELKKEMNFIYDKEREEVRYSTMDLYQLIKKWKETKIKDLPTFKNYYKAYQRVARWLHIRRKINDDDFKLWFWAGLHRTFQKKVEARMRIKDRSLDDTKAFDVPRIVEAAQLVFTRKRFENRIKLMLEKSPKDSDDESDSESSDEGAEETEETESDEDDRAEILSTRIAKLKKSKRVSFREPEKPVSPTRCSNGDISINELIKQMKGLNLDDEAYRVLFNKAIRMDPSWRYVLRAPAIYQRDSRTFERDVPPHMNRVSQVFNQSGEDTRLINRRCFGCGKENHTINQCDKIQNKINQGVIRKDMNGRWMWKDGTEVVRKRGETWIEAINSGAKHVGIARAI